MGFRHWTEGRRVGGGVPGKGQGWGVPTAAETVIGSSWFLSNNVGWVMSGEGGRVMQLDLSSSES